MWCQPQTRLTSFSVSLQRVVCTAGLKWYPHPALIHCVKGCEVSPSKWCYSHCCYGYVNHDFRLLYLLSAVNIPLTDSSGRNQQSHFIGHGTDAQRYQQTHSNIHLVANSRDSKPGVSGSEACVQHNTASVREAGRDEAVLI